MSEQANENIHDRIDRALARIEAAARKSVSERAALVGRHEELRRSVEQAIAALDGEIAGARTTPEAEDAI